MIIGIPKEIKNNENRVALTPAGVHVLTAKGHQVLLENGAGIGSSFEDNAYLAAGATLTSDVKKIWSAEMVMKVKEPLPSEYHYFREGLILFTYLHLAPATELTEMLLKHRVTAIGYETVQELDGSLPLLTPMSEVAGRMAVQIGAQFLEKNYGGSGILLGGVPGVSRGKVVIIGGGTAGQNAAKIALGMGAHVVILDVNPSQLAKIDARFNGQVETCFSNTYYISQATRTADLVIGAVLIPGGRAPKLVTDEMVQKMKKGSVLIDIAIDQGGIFETTDHVTTHDDPVYLKHGVLHYAVANMPGAVAKTATEALSNVTTGYALKLAQTPLSTLIHQNQAILKGVNTFKGELTNQEVAKAQGKTAVNLLELF